MWSSGSRAKQQLEAGARNGLTIGSSVGETQRWDKHVVAPAGYAEDVGSTPTASTILLFLSLVQARASLC